MYDPTSAVSLPGYLRDLERRLAERERANPISRASFHDGTRTRGAIGKFVHPDTSEQHGAIFYDTSGAELLRVDDTTATVTDSSFRIADDVDATKLVSFDTTAVATATTRTISMPDADVDLGDMADIATNTSDISTNTAAIALNTAKISYTDAAQVATNTSDISTNTAAIALNTAKVSNATHTGDVTGATALTLASTAVTGQTLVTADAADHVLIADASDSGSLKKSLVSDFGGATAIANFNVALPSTIEGSLDWGQLLPGYALNDYTGSLTDTYTVLYVHYYPFIAPADFRITSARFWATVSGGTARFAVCEYDAANHNPGARVGAQYTGSIGLTSSITGMTIDLTAGVQYAAMWSVSTTKTLYVARTQRNQDGWRWAELSGGNWDQLGQIWSTSGGASLGSNETDPNNIDATTTTDCYLPFLIRTEGL